jgi:hypothetical protein
MTSHVNRFRVLLIIDSGKTQLIKEGICCCSQPQAKFAVIHHNSANTCYSSTCLPSFQGGLRTTRWLSSSADPMPLQTEPYNLCFIIGACGNAGASHNPGGVDYDDYSFDYPCARRLLTAVIAKQTCIYRKGRVKICFMAQMKLSISLPFINSMGMLALQRRDPLRISRLIWEHWEASGATPRHQLLGSFGSAAVRPSKPGRISFFSRLATLLAFLLSTRFCKLLSRLHDSRH